MNKKIRRHMIIGAMTLLSSSLCLNSAFAQRTPTLRLVVGSAPGGIADHTARVMAEKLSRLLEQTVVVENKPGAATRIANGEVKRSAPDGSTLLFSPLGSLTVLPHLYSEQSLGYRPSDFVPVGRVASFEYLLAVNPSLKVNNLLELRALIAKKPELATIANPGTGTIPNLLSMVLATNFNLPLVHVAYKGSGPAAADLVAGHVSLLIGTPAELVSLHQNGRIRVIASISEQRSPGFPDVSTLKEQGENLAAESLLGLWAPAGTPPATIQRLNQALTSTINDPAIQEQLTKSGLRAASSTPEELLAIQQQDSQQWANFIKQVDLKIPN